MATLSIANTCVKCDTCRTLCPEESIILDDGQYYIDTWTCTQCGICLHLCPVDCIKESEAGD